MVRDVCHTLRDVLTLRERYVRCSHATCTGATELVQAANLWQIPAPSASTIIGTLVADGECSDTHNQRKESVMNAKQLGAEVILVAFSAFSAYVIYQYGYVGLFEQALANAATVQVFLDLSIALSLVMVWMWQDGHKHDIAPLPYVLLTLTLGSIGPLLYLVRRFGKESSALSHPQTPQAARL